MASHALRLCRTVLFLRPVLPRHPSLVAGARAISEDRVGEGEEENEEQSTLAAKLVAFVQWAWCIDGGCV